MIDHASRITDPEYLAQADQLSSKERFRDAVTFWTIVLGSVMLTGVVYVLNRGWEFLRKTRRAGATVGGDENSDADTSAGHKKNQPPTATAASMKHHGWIEQPCQGLWRRTKTFGQKPPPISAD